MTSSLALWNGCERSYRTELVLIAPRKPLCGMKSGSAPFGGGFKRATLNKMGRPAKTAKKGKTGRGAWGESDRKHFTSREVRPRSPTTTLIQLDDLDAAKAERMAPHSFIVFQTSPGKFQAWVAVEKGAPPDFRRRRCLSCLV